MKVKADLTDLGKSFQALQVRMSTFDAVLHKENMDFKMSLIDRKIQVLESRMAKTTEDRSNSTNMIGTLYNLPTPPKRPSTSKHRASLHSRTMSSQPN